MTLITHIEKHLGNIDKGWKLPDSSLSIQIVRFKNQPVEGATTYMTLGLSDYTLNLNEDKHIHQELIFSAYSTYPSEHIASFMTTFAEYMISNKKGLLRGDVVGPSTSLIPNVPVNSIYASIPIYFNDDFYIYKEHEFPTILVWLVPLLEDECKFTNQQGWSEFEDILELTNPDLLNLNRPSIFSKNNK